MEKGAKRASPVKPWPDAPSLPATKQLLARVIRCKTSCCRGKGSCGTSQCQGDAVAELPPVLGYKSASNQPLQAMGGGHVGFRLQRTSGSCALGRRGSGSRPACRYTSRAHLFTALSTTSCVKGATSRPGTASASPGPINTRTRIPENQYSPQSAIRDPQLVQIPSHRPPTN